MGNPAFYYYPESGSSLEVVDWGRPISDLYMVPQRTRVDALGGDGVPRHRLGGGGAKVAIRRERFSDAALERKLRNVEDHLIRGGRVAFTWDTSRAWAGYGTGGLSRGDAICYTGGNAFTRWSASAALSTGDELVIESCNPEMKREVNTVSSITRGQILLGTTAVHTYEYRHFVRWRWFFPALYLPADQIGQSLVLSDRGLNWSFGAELAIDPRILAVGLEGYTPSGGGVGAGTPGGWTADLGLGGTDAARVGASTLTLEELLAGVSSVGSPSGIRPPSRYTGRGSRSWGL